MSRTARLRLGMGLIGVGLIVAAAAWYQSTMLPKRFAAVVPGRLYRSGEVTPAQLARLRDVHQIERIVCLLNPAEPVTQAERDAAEELGLDWRNVPLTGDGASDADARRQILKLLREPNAPPTLVHCAAGVNRTGLAVGLYRITEQGWTYEQVLDEMRRFDFDDLPKHENLRQALRSAASATTRPATTAPAITPN